MAAPYTAFTYGGLVTFSALLNPPKFIAPTNVGGSGGSGGGGGTTSNYGYVR